MGLFSHMLLAFYLLLSGGFSQSNVNRSNISSSNCHCINGAPCILTNCTVQVSTIPSSITSIDFTDVILEFFETTRSASFEILVDQFKATNIIFVYPFAPTSGIETSITILVNQQFVLSNAEIILNQTSFSIVSSQFILITNSSLSVYNAQFLSETDITFVFTVFNTTQQLCRANCSCNQNSICDNWQNSTRYPSFPSLLSRYSQAIHQFPSSEPYEPLQFSQFIKSTQTNLDLLNNTTKQNGVQFFTLLLMAQDFCSLNNSSLQASYIGIYSTSTSISSGSQLNTSGSGCSQSYGYGCGFLDWIMGLRLQCGGTGASHGGMGGQSQSPSIGYLQTCLQMTSRNIYDNPFNPLFEGSGGGGQNESSLIGRGGGVIYIESAWQVINDGIISCSGSSVYPNTYYGGGSGGSLQIHTIIFAGQGSIQCNGGGASQNNSIGYGGNGGGGRIKINLTQWYRLSQQNIVDEQYKNSSLNLNVVASAGQQFLIDLSQSQVQVTQTQQQGSIFTTPCLQGYQVAIANSQSSYNNQNSFTCQSCPNGFYKFQINAGQCKQCYNLYKNKDKGLIFNSTFSVFNCSHNQLQMSPMCKVIDCSDSTYKYLNEELNICQTELQHIVSLLGGENGVFAIIISLILFLISIFIYIIKKARKNRPSAINQSIIEGIDPGNIMARREESSAKTNFVVEDLPYHAERIYLSGKNSYSKPWQAIANLETDFPEIQDQGPIKLLFIDFNRKAKYSRFQKWSLIFLRYYYYPVYYILLQYLRKRKFLSLTRFLERKKVEALNTNDTGAFFKFSATSDFTIAHIDILNYNQDVLGWSSKIQFPVTFVLQGFGTFLYPLQINLSDPLMKSLHLTFQNHLIPNCCDIDQDDKNPTSFLESYVSEFNKRVKLIDFRQSFSQFLKYFVNLVKFTDDWNQEHFSKVGVVVDLCIHIMENEIENKVKKDNDRSKFILVRVCEKKKLEQWLQGRIYQTYLQDVHSYQNYSDEFTVQFSVNFDEIRKGSWQGKEQIGLNATNNINRQIEMYKLHEDDREQLNNLKMAMKRRIDQGEEEKKAVKVVESQQLNNFGSDYFYQNYSNYVDFNQTEEVLSLQSQHELAKHQRRKHKENQSFHDESKKISLFRNLLLHDVQIDSDKFKVTHGYLIFSLNLLMGTSHIFN